MNVGPEFEAFKAYTQTSFEAYLDTLDRSKPTQYPAHEEIVSYFDNMIRTRDLGNRGTRALSEDTLSQMLFEIVRYMEETFPQCCCSWSTHKTYEVKRQFARWVFDNRIR